MTLIHASCVTMREGGVLLRGPSGSGKSDLALRLIDAGGRLVADDYVALSAGGGRLVAAAPAAIRGLLEVRGLGVVEVPHVSSCVIRLVVDLVAAGAVPRLPDPESEAFGGVAVPRLALVATEASAVAKVRLALTVPRTDPVPG